MQTSHTQLHIRHAGQQAFIVAIPAGQGSHHSISDLFVQVADVLIHQGMTIVHERLFGSLSQQESIMAMRQAAFEARGISTTNPITFIEGLSPWDQALAGVIVRAVHCSQERDKAWTLYDRNRAVGIRWETQGCGGLILQNVQAEIHTKDPSAYVENQINKARQLLILEGLSYDHVVRTWFYLSDILDWYGPFNDIRNRTYDTFGLMPKDGAEHLLLPASTGIGAVNPQGSPAALDLVAVYGEESNHPQVRQLTNPGQEDAHLYGSAFSRGAVVQQQDFTWMEISGTAAIDEQGRSLYRDDIRAQITCTLDKLEILLAQEGANLNNICTASVFLKRPHYAQDFLDIIADRGLDGFPGICVVADVCRDELLFEIDAEAVL